MEEEGDAGKKMSREELNFFIEIAEDGGLVEVEGFSIRNPLIRQRVALEKLQKERLVSVTTEIELNYVVKVEGVE
jgi:hypothetical protein